MGRECAPHCAHSNTRRRSAGTRVRTPFPPNLSPITTQEEPQGTQEMEGADSLGWEYCNYWNLPTLSCVADNCDVYTFYTIQVRELRSGQADNTRTKQEVLPDLSDPGLALSWVPSCKCWWRRGAKETVCQRQWWRGRWTEPRADGKGCLGSLSLLTLPPAALRREKELTKMTEGTWVSQTAQYQ